MHSTANTKSASATAVDDGRAPKKVRRRDEDPPDGGGMMIEDPPDDGGMMVDDPPQPRVSFKEKLMNSQGERSDLKESSAEEEFAIGEDDVVRDYDESEPKITFKERILQLVEKSMERTVIVKLLGRSINYNALQNRLCAIWRPMGQLFLMDLENDYYQVSFNHADDYRKVLTDGPWIVYGHILTVQPWSPDFTPKKPHPSSVVVWVRIPGIPGAFYKRPLVKAIGDMVGKVVKIDENTISATRGRFVRMAVVVDLARSLKSRVWVNGVPYEVNYESLPKICYECGKYGHMKMDCPTVKGQNSNDARPGEEETSNMIEVEVPPAPKEKFGSWMMAPRRHWKPARQAAEKPAANRGVNYGGSKFNFAALGGDVDGGDREELRNDGGSKFNFAALKEMDENGNAALVQPAVMAGENLMGVTAKRSIQLKASGPLVNADGASGSGKGYTGRGMKVGKAHSVKVHTKQGKIGKGLGSKSDYWNEKNKEVSLSELENRSRPSKSRLDPNSHSVVRIDENINPNSDGAPGLVDLRHLRPFPKEVGSSESESNGTIVPLAGALQQLADSLSREVAMEGVEEEIDG